MLFFCKSSSWIWEGCRSIPSAGKWQHWGSNPGPTPKPLPLTTMGMRWMAENQGQARNHTPTHKEVASAQLRLPALPCTRTPSHSLASQTERKWSCSSYRAATPSGGYLSEVSGEYVYFGSNNNPKACVRFPPPESLVQFIPKDYLLKLSTNVWYAQGLEYICTYITMSV